MKRFKKAVLKCPPLLIALYFLLRIRYGFSVYRMLCIRYGIKHTWYSAFLPSTGDMFFAAAVYPELKRLEQTQQEGIFLAVGDSGRQISEWFELERFVILRERQSNNLLRLYRFLAGRSALSFRVLHYQPAQMYIGICEALLSFHHLDFLTMLCETAYGGLNKQMVIRPKTNRWTAEAAKTYLIQQGLQPGRTVILAPNANCVQKLTPQFWQTLAEKLHNLGYSVCTNCAPDEAPISGTVKLQLQYQELAMALSQAGHLIALRSGLVDITGFIPCKRVLLYPRQNFNVWGVGSVLDCFSLKRMGICCDAAEFEFEADEQDALMLRVIQEVSTWRREEEPGSQVCETG